ncbi:MAG TPA: alpha-ketoglutarate-dependent dioxygenase AlkB [Methylocella sp.]|nr:alpha-ketoglutarate-dependent dioxygenase AlkB [Methylocella sp.]
MQETSGRFLHAASRPPIWLAPGLGLFRNELDRQAQPSLVSEILDAARAAPWFIPRMPRTGRPFSVRMTNCGSLGWVSDREGGYRYQPTHPATGQAWAPIPRLALEIWRSCSAYAHPPEACLVNFYDSRARMGLHQDRDEEDMAAPVVSISLGDSCRFRYGGLRRSDPVKNIDLYSGDVLVLGGAARLVFHGVDKIYRGTSDLLPESGRINLTLRRVTRPTGK